MALAEQIRAQRDESRRVSGAEARAWSQQWQSERHRLTHYDSSLIPLAVERTQRRAGRLSRR